MIGSAQHKCKRCGLANSTGRCPWCVGSIIDVRIPVPPQQTTQAAQAGPVRDGSDTRAVARNLDRSPAQTSNGKPNDTRNNGSHPAAASARGDLTTWQKIVVVAAAIGPATKEQLAVACWTRWPETFGLEGYRDQYPDSGRVFSKCTNTVGGLYGRGLLDVSAGVITITKKGRTAIARLT